MRVHMPFRREQLAARDIAEGSIVVQPGQSLWRLARRAYGSGVRYTVIYQANRDQNSRSRPDLSRSNIRRAGGGRRRRSQWRRTRRVKHIEIARRRSAERVNDFDTSGFGI